MAFVQPPLPYGRSELEPHMSAQTVGCHYDQHHAGYVAALNALTKATPLADLSLPQVILKTAGDPQQKAVYQNAAQAWNHEFFWNSMKPDGGLSGASEMQDRTVSAFGSMRNFDRAFIDAAAKLFGSGWVWLVEHKGELKVVPTENATPPMVLGFRPLLVCDVWEHAYYLDHRSDRKGFVLSFLTSLANWDMALQRLHAPAAIGL